MVSCQTCHKKFVHRKHLNRHRLVHEKNRTFPCNTCSKAFARKDALQRHELTHQTTTNLVRSRGRACTLCVAAKTKCTGSLPCQRCTSRNVSCSYTPTLPDSQHISDSPMATECLASGRDAFMSQEATGIFDSRLETLHQQSGDAYNTEINDEVGITNHLPDSFTQQTDTQVRSDTDDLSMHCPYVPGLAPENTNLSSHVHGVPSIPSVNARLVTMLDQSDWEPYQNSSINWLEMDAVNLDYIPMRDLFPTALSGDNFPSPNSWQYPVASPTQGGASIVFLPAVSEANTESPQDDTNHLSAPSIASANGHGLEDPERGSYYVDGDKARRTRRKRRRVMSFARSPPVLDFNLASSVDVPLLDTTICDDYHISEGQYQQLNASYQALCLDTTFFRPFPAATFLSRALIHRLVQSYFDSFHQSLPFLHQPTFRGCDRSHLLLLAMATLGARFLEHEAATSISVSLTELLRRSILQASEYPQQSLLREPDMIQVRLLYSIAASFGGGADLVALTSDCVSTFDTPFSQQTKYRQMPLNETGWALWARHEENARSKLCMWLVDCLIASHTGLDPRLSLSDVSDVQLPCTESLWSSISWEEWSVVRQHNPEEAPSLDKALQELYVQKQLPSDLGEFARIIVIHGIYHRTWDVRGYMQQQSSHFEPSAQPQPSIDVSSPLPVWHPKMETFNKWRNSALDCIDILHWNANSLINLAHGLEHPTVLHLHFSRIALLCPMRQILRLARFLSEAGAVRLPPASFHEVEQDFNIVQQWVAQDQYKARLATIHAGAILWHVRRYSTGAFHEPGCVALGILLLWAHSKFFIRCSLNRTGPTLHEDIQQPQPGWDMIMLDRPVDDELVQQFVREGNQMHANIKGVGDLFGPQGAQRVLGQGRILLGTLTAWPEACACWLDLLKKLEDADKGREELQRSQ